ncbi:transcriptional regulator [Pseudomonas sp. LS44]|uniref:transcriptional regulator n=1 Tax=Pseudomonas sp. LS44 TaxID=1357074 RepID=UPI00215B74B4|nr:transcriptional regulator [Pseudomonas sp. LS44]UVE18030.1 transcriptional regulator [Pseudomonas sp. LS44]
MFKRSSLALLAFVSLPLLAAEQPSTKQVMKDHKAAIQNQIADIDYKRKQITEAGMQLNGAEGEKFWPIYNSYRTEADKLSKEAITLVLDYAKSYNSNTVDDATAAKLQERLFDLQEDKLELKEKYAKRVAKEVSPLRSLRFVQIEDQLDAISLLANTRDIPLAE